MARAMMAKRVVGTTALGAAIAIAACGATAVPDLAALTQRSEHIELPFRADFSGWTMFRRADGVFDFGDFRVLVRWLEESDEELDQYDVVVEERGGQLTRLRCGWFAETLLNVPGSTSTMLRCRDEERGSLLRIEESFEGMLKKVSAHSSEGAPIFGGNDRYVTNTRYIGPLFYMQFAEGCLAGVGMARDCHSASSPLVVAARHCPADLKQFHLGLGKKPVVPGRLEAAAVIERNKANVFVPSYQPARDFVVSSMVLLLSFARLDRPPRGKLVGISSCE